MRRRYSGFSPFPFLLFCPRGVFGKATFLVFDKEEDG